MKYLQTASREDVLPLLPSLSPSGPEPELQDNPHPVGGWPLLCSCPLPPSPLSSAFSSFKVVGGHLPQGARPKTRECQPHSPSWQHGPVVKSGVWSLEGPSPRPGAAGLQPVSHLTSSCQDPLRK